MTAAAGSVERAMDPIPVHVLIDQQPIRSETTAGALGGDLVAFTTTLADHAFQLTSSYLGDGRVDPAVSELVIRGDEHRTRARTLEVDQNPVTHARRRLLLDHAARLQELLSGHLDGPVVMVEIPDAALEQADRTWPKARPT